MRTAFAVSLVWGGVVMAVIPVISDILYVNAAAHCLIASPNSSVMLDGKMSDMWRFSYPAIGVLMIGTAVLLSRVSPP